jgi:hypothetical protein
MSNMGFCDERITEIPLFVRNDNPGVSAKVKIDETARPARLCRVFHKSSPSLFTTPNRVG